MSNSTVSASVRTVTGERNDSVSFADEVDPYKKPKELIQVSPKGLVPALRFDVIGAQIDANEEPRALNESTVILDYIEE